MIPLKVRICLPIQPTIWWLRSVIKQKNDKEKETMNSLYLDLNNMTLPADKWIKCTYVCMWMYEWLRKKEMIKEKKSFWIKKRNNN